MRLSPFAVMNRAQTLGTETHTMAVYTHVYIRHSPKYTRSTSVFAPCFHDSNFLSAEHLIRTEPLFERGESTPLASANRHRMRLLGNVEYIFFVNPSNLVEETGLCSNRGSFPTNDVLNFWFSVEFNHLVHSARKRWLSRYLFTVFNGAGRLRSASKASIRTQQNIYPS